MNYKINPVKASTKAYKNGYCDIRNLNNTCFDVCSAFKGSDNNWNISPQCEAQCEDLVNQMRINTFGVGWCDHQPPRRPVKWGNVPHFFPALFNKHKDVPRALAECLDKCNGTNLPGECCDACNTDSYAVEGYGVAYDDDDDPDFGKYEKSHPVPFWIGVGVATVFFLVFVFILFRFLMN